MAQFEESIRTVLEHEGGYVHHPNDPGGETKFGISKRQYPTLDIKTLNIQQAKQIYLQDYWLGLYNEIASQPVATKILDMVVNMGHGRAHKILQTALNYVIAGPVIVDGKFGPQTLKFLNAADPDKLLHEIRALCADYYCRLVLDDPTKKTFLFGWLRRAIS